MPIIKSAIKANRQNKTHRERNRHYKSRMKTLIKNFLNTATTDKKKAEKLLPGVYSAIDTCYKKNLIKRNNASHKKSRVAKTLVVA